jgi:hypothetical protein
VAVNDAARHASLASLARICLVYVDCIRGTERQSVAAAFTSGDADQLIVGRNGVLLRPPGPRLAGDDHEDRRSPHQSAAGVLVACTSAPRVC